MPRAWLAEEFDDDPETWILGNGPAGLFARSLAACAKNTAMGADARDGWLPMQWAWARVTGTRREPDAEGQIAALLDAGWWESMSAGECRVVEVRRDPKDLAVTIGPHKHDGLYVVNFLQKNPARCEIEAMTRVKSEAGRKGALKRWAA